MELNLDILNAIGGKEAQNAEPEESRKKPEIEIKGGVYPFEGLYKELQSNILKSEQLRSDIIKGLREGEDIYRLFLKAVEAIGLMTGINALSGQVKDDLKSIYGIGLQERKPLELELEETETRLRKLREAETGETEPDSRQRIKRAIQAHESRIEYIKGLITKSNGKPA